MLSSSPSKIHEPRVTGVSPRPTTSDSARKLRNTRGERRSGLTPDVGRPICMSWLASEEECPVGMLRAAFGSHSARPKTASLTARDKTEVLRDGPPDCDHG